MAAGGMFEMVFLVFGFGGLGLPLGVPPAPEDPLLARIAPEPCLFYASWAGVAEPDPTSKNQTERLLAEPEVRQFVREVERHVRRAIRQAAQREGPEAAALAEDAIGWIETLATRPTAVFVADVKLGARGPEIRAGAVVHLGEDAATIRASLERHQQALPGGMVDQTQIDGDRWHRLRLAPGAPVITWGLQGKYLIAAVGDGVAEQILQRARSGAAPTWLAEIGKQLPVPRRSTVAYLNVGAIRDLVVPMVGPQARQVVEALGLANVTTVTGVSGLDETGFVSRTLVGLDGEPAGLLSLVAGKPLEANDLVLVPHDATLAAVVRLDADRMLRTIQTIAREIEPRAADELAGGLRQMESQLGIDLREDLLQSLGDVWCVYNAPSEGGFVVTGLTAVVRVRDPQRLAKTHARLLEVARGALGDQPPGRRGGARIVESQFAGRRLWHLDLHEQFPLAPAWCLTDQELIVALFPQNVKSFLGRGADYRSLADQREVAGMLEGPSAPSALAYQNVPASFDVGYPMLQFASRMAVVELGREGVPIDLSVLPSAASIRRHLRPGTSTLRRTAAGIEVATRQSVPGGSAVLTSPMAVALLLPAVQSARSAARRTASANNLKMIGLAMHMYHDVYKHFPAAYSTDQAGKPLLSWRVHLLPFVEEQALYEQFHLDEPWDSEHNKHLIARMPAVYRSPASRAEPGRTNYLGVRGQEMILAGAKGTGIAQVLDGTSNTIMVVEASDAAAVVWTRPDDFEPTKEQPTKGLLGLYPGGFNAAFCDGSVQFLPASIDPKTLWKLFTRAGGEAVSRRELGRARSDRRFGPPGATSRVTPKVSVPPPRQPR